VDLIGVITKEHEVPIAEEFFELFKTPWEFYNPNNVYDVVMSSKCDSVNIDTRLFIIYCSDETEFDREYNIRVETQQEMEVLNYADWRFPIYGKFATFKGKGTPLIKTEVNHAFVSVEVGSKRRKTLRIGYDLFDEVHRLLSSGQPSEYALTPTLEIHISILRGLILRSQIPVIEIPPVPAGHQFICCLTHDVDFAGIRNHILDHTLLGFLYRAVVMSLVSWIRGHGSWPDVLTNWKAVLSLPLVYSGVIEDFWLGFDNYMKIENGHHATYFVIPFKGRAGGVGSKPASKKRAAKYDLRKLKSHLDRLQTKGCEIGLHGIDAWQDVKKAREEVDRLSAFAANQVSGVRMHWLYFNHDSPAILEEAGLCYDSTLGYNDAVGYWCGTTQMFRPFGATRLLELPLVIQDTSMFYPKRMGLQKKEALELCRKVVRNSTLFGGALVVNWHDRSLAPERLWGDVYRLLLNEIETQKAWFGTASSIAQWFENRRKIGFAEVHCGDSWTRVTLRNVNISEGPPAVVRFYRPEQNAKTDIPIPENRGDSVDILCGR
jgi:hypothetical protein